MGALSDYICKSNEAPDKMVEIYYIYCVCIHTHIFVQRAHVYMYVYKIMTKGPPCAIERNVEEKKISEFT